MKIDDEADMAAKLNLFNRPVGAKNSFPADSFLWLTASFEMSIIVVINAGSSAERGGRLAAVGNGAEAQLINP